MRVDPLVPLHPIHFVERSEEPNMQAVTTIGLDIAKKQIQMKLP